MCKGEERLGHGYSRVFGRARLLERKIGSVDRH